MHYFYAKKDVQNGGDVGMCYITEFRKKYSSKILNLTRRVIKKNQVSLISAKQMMLENLKRFR
jgi:hypothetical protein